MTPVTAATSAAGTATISPYEADPAGWLGWPGDGDAGWAMSGEEATAAGRRAASGSATTRASRSTASALARSTPVPPASAGAGRDVRTCRTDVVVAAKHV